MALNLAEEQKIIEGKEAPFFPPSPSPALVNLSRNSAINFARDFAVGASNPEDETDPVKKANAQIYLDKMLNAVTRILAADSTAINSLLLVISSYIAGDPIITPTLLASATTSNWEDFVNNNIKKAIELFAGVTNVEKDAYDNPTP